MINPKNMYTMSFYLFLTNIGTVGYTCISMLKLTSCKQSMREKYGKVLNDCTVSHTSVHICLNTITTPH